MNSHIGDINEALQRSLCDKWDKAFENIKLRIQSNGKWFKNSLPLDECKLNIAISNTTSSH